MSSHRKPACNEQQFCGACTGGTPDNPFDGLGGPHGGLGEIPLLSRTGLSHPRGKLDGFLEKVRMHSETIAVLQLMAAREGLTLSEFVRIHLDCIAWGDAAVATMAADKIARVRSLAGTNVGADAPRGAEASR